MLLIHENPRLFTNYDIRTYISQNQMKMRLVSVLRMMVFPRRFSFFLDKDIHFSHSDLG
jgi:hypothetical protein